MPHDLDPILDTWYRHRDKGQQFKIVAIDQDMGLIELQYFDGSLQEIARDDWQTLLIDVIETPQDWTGPLDNVERDDLGYSETDMEAPDWAANLDEQPPRHEPWQQKNEAQDRNDWDDPGPEEDLFEERT